ncbi:MAG: OsmC family protein [Anaerolineales bacterium]|nr:OsmC family protein [Anaerolineales bacterium]MBX3038830.1 OsmC family protein [Anaerolineales bacterium]
MKISVKAGKNKDKYQKIRVTSDNISTTLSPKSIGIYSNINGGELLFMALAISYCNAICSKAEEDDIALEKFEIEIYGEFEDKGKEVKGITCEVKVKAKGDTKRIHELFKGAHAMAEIQNTIKRSTEPSLIINITSSI